MTFKNTAVKTISDSIISDISPKLEALKKEYLESHEFATLVSERLEEVKRLENIANQMNDETNLEDLERASIYLNSVEFVYNKELSCFVSTYLENNANYHVQSNLGINRSYYKLEYITNRVKAIISTLDDSMSFADIQKYIDDSIDLKEILFNKDI
jgi:hypothetical protein